MKKLLTVLLTLVMAVCLINLNNSRAKAEDPDYLKFTAVEATDVAFKVTGTLDTPPSLKYSKNGDAWSSYTLGSTISLAKGDNVKFKANVSNSTFSKDSDNYISFTSTGKVNASGNIMSLVDESCTNLVIPCDFCFYNIFLNCTNLLSAPKFPATTLTDKCYGSAFNGCTSLTEPPELPADILKNSCYSKMFYGCTSLVETPKLNATTLDSGCYNSMFYGCTSLTKAPDLPATELKDGCYNGMFNGCTSLTKAPDLPATELKNGCYNSMFYGCTSLTKAPDLPSTTLAMNCYNSMFYGCTSLTKAPELKATTLASLCYTSMFNGCSKLNVKSSNPEEANVVLPSSVGTANANNMFAGTNHGEDVLDTPTEGYYFVGSKDPAPTPDPQPKDESCEKVIGPSWHWNNTKGVCEDYGVVGTATR